MSRRHDYNKSHAHRIDLREPRNEKIIKQPSSPELLRNWKLDFLRKPNNSWLCDIPNEFIEDTFNTYGLKDEVEYFNVCREIILGKSSLSSLQKTTYNEIERILPKAYGLIHARYIMSPDGLRSVKAKYETKDYGRCPRVNCGLTPLLPIGLSSTYGESKVKNYCPCCREIYEPHMKVDLDGAFFGPNMAHIFIDEMIRSNDGYPFRYIPTQHDAFGFRIRNKNFKPMHEINNQ